MINSSKWESVLGKGEERKWVLLFLSLFRNCKVEIFRIMLLRKESHKKRIMEFQMYYEDTVNKRAV